MTSIRHDQYSLTINGTRVVIRSASLHYFRLPGKDLWVDRLSKLKYAGYNTIDLYFPWSYHSMSEHEYDFTEHKDIKELLQLTKNFGFYVIARPGPYINAELSGGGFPLWLMQKKEVILRNRVEGEFHYSKEYMHYVKGWYEKIIPILNQFDHIIAFQLENEYATLEVEPDYLLELKALAKNLGVTVPLMHNDMHAAGLYTEHIDLYAIDNYAITYFDSDWRSFPEVFTLLDNLEETIRPYCPDSPLFIVELQAGWFDSWGGITYDKIRTHLGREALDIVTKTALSQGLTMFNHYMGAGGTSWNNIGCSEVYTSYDFAALLKESGEPTGTFYTAKNINLFLATFDLTKTDHCGSDCLELMPLGDNTLYKKIRIDQSNNKWLFLRNNATEIEEISILDKVKVKLKPQEMIILPHHYTQDFITIDTTNMPLCAKLTDDTNTSLFMQGCDNGEAYIHIQTPLSDFIQSEYVSFTLLGDSTYRLLYTAPDKIGKIILTNEEKTISLYILPDKLIDYSFYYKNQLICGVDFLLENQKIPCCALQKSSSITVFSAKNSYETNLAVESIALNPLYPSTFKITPKTLIKAGSPIFNQLDMDTNHLQDSYALYQTCIPQQTEYIDIEARHCYALFLNGEEIGHGIVFDNPKEEDPPEPARYVIPQELLTEEQNELLIFVRSLGHTKGFEDDTLMPRGLLTGSVFPAKNLNWTIAPLNLQELAEDTDPSHHFSPIIQLDLTFNIPKLDPFHASKHLVFEDDIIQQADIYLNNKMIGHYIHSLGPQNKFYLPESFLVSGENTLSLCLWQHGKGFSHETLKNIFSSRQLSIKFGDIYKYIALTDITERRIT